MSRVQLALNVTDLEEAISFYSKLLASQPAKVRPGYANFDVTDPPLKLVLIEDSSRPPGSLNHLGIEVASADEVVAAEARLADRGLATTVEKGVTCCHAWQDKVWVSGPGEQPWEIYTVLADGPMPSGALGPADPGDAVCCSAGPTSAGAGPSSCC